MICGLIIYAAIQIKDSNLNQVFLHIAVLPAERDNVDRYMDNNWQTLNLTDILVNDTKFGEESFYLGVY